MPVTPSTVANSNSSNTVSKPASVVSGDVLTVYIAALITPTLAGWTQIDSITNASSGVITTVLKKVAGGSEPATYTFSSTSGNYLTITMARYTGADAAAALDGTPTKTTTATTSLSIVAPTLTTAVADSLLVTYAVAYNIGANTTSVTPPAGMTEQVEYIGGGAATEVSTETRASAGATGTRTVTFVGGSAANYYNNVIMFALKAAANDPVSVTTKGTASATGTTATSLTSVTSTITKGTAAAAGTLATSSATQNPTSTTTKGTATATGTLATASVVQSATSTTTKGTSSATGTTATSSATQNPTSVTTKGTASAAGTLATSTATQNPTSTTTTGTAAAAGRDVSSAISYDATSVTATGTASAFGYLATASIVQSATSVTTQGTATAAGYGVFAAVPLPAIPFKGTATVQSSPTGPRGSVRSAPRIQATVIDSTGRVSGKVSG